MMSLIALYLSLIMQVVAAGFAISLVKKTKYNISWILISGGLLILVVARLMELSPIFLERQRVEFTVVERWMNFSAAFVFLIGIFYVNKLIYYLLRIESLRQKMERRILSVVVRTEDRERQRFAKELHDGLGPILGVIKMFVTASSVAESDEERRKINESAAQAVEEAITSVREIAANISPHILSNFGLYAAVDAFVKRINWKIQVNFEANFKEMRFPYTVENIMYRVICELINNTMRHAEATAINIKIRYDKSKLTLEYSDNGKGFDVDRETLGMGLENMRYRLHSGNGDLEIFSTPGKGMRAIASLPCDIS